MAEHENESQKRNRRITRRAFLAGGAVIGGTVLWGATNDLASGGIIHGPIIPTHGTGGTGGTGPQPIHGPIAAGAGGSPGLTVFTVDTGFDSAGSSPPLFPFRFR